jgi:hypothetical protein
MSKQAYVVATPAVQGAVVVQGGAAPSGQAGDQKVGIWQWVTLAGFTGLAGILLSVGASDSYGKVEFTGSCTGDFYAFLPDGMCDTSSGSDCIEWDDTDTWQAYDDAAGSGTDFEGGADAMDDAHGVFGAAAAFAFILAVVMIVPVVMGMMRSKANMIRYAAMGLLAFVFILALAGFISTLSTSQLNASDWLAVYDFLGCDTVIVSFQGGASAVLVAIIILFVELCAIYPCTR